MKNTQLSEMRKKYAKIALGFMTFIFALSAAFMVVIFEFRAEPEGGPVMDRAMPEHVPDKGIFYMEPDLLVYCGNPPVPMDWNFFKDDGTIDGNKVVEFSEVLTKWDECAEEYTMGILAYAASTDLFKAVVMSSAGDFFLDLVPEYSPDMGKEILEHDELQPGTFQCDSCHDNLKR